MFKSSMKWVLLLSVIALSQSTPDLRSDPAPIIYPGQVNIGLISNIHGPAMNGSSGCGPLRPEAVQRAMAAVWAAHQANFKKDDPQELNIGVYIFDTCGNEEIAERQVYRLLGHVGHVQTTDCSQKRIPPLFAVITEGEPGHLKVPLKLLNAFSVPVISASGIQKNKYHLLSTAPTSMALSRAAVSVLQKLHLLEVAVLANDDSSLSMFNEFSRQAANVTGMKTTEVDSQEGGATYDIMSALRALPRVGRPPLQAVVFLMSPDQAMDLINTINEDNSPEMTWMIVTASDISGTVAKQFDKKHLRNLEQVLLLSPGDTDVPEFEEYFKQLLEEDTVKYHPLLVEYLQTEELRHSDESEPSNHTHTSHMPQDVSSTVKAVWILAQSLKQVQKRSCRRGTDCLLYLKRSLSSYVGRAAVELDSGLDKMRRTGFNMGHDGEFTPVSYKLKGFSDKGDIINIGYYSEDSGLSIDPNMLIPLKDFGPPKSEVYSYQELTTTLNDTFEEPPSTEKPDYIEWKILEEGGRRNRTTINLPTSQTKPVPTVDTEKEISLVVALKKKAGLHQPNLNESLHGAEEEAIGNDVGSLGPAYSSDPSEEASNFMSISLSSHQEPRLTEAYKAESASRVDKMQPNQHRNPAEDIKVQRSSTTHISAWLARPWALSVLGISGVLSLATLYILVFMFVKTCEGTLKKANCSLAATQLLALLCLYLSAVLFTWKPSVLMCGLQRLLPNISLAFCYGGLLIKGMYLRAQNSLGLGGSVNGCNQMLTLLFIVGVQIALETQWWMIHPPALASNAFECLTNKMEILESQIYIAALIILVVSVALATRKIPYNQPESRSLIATSITCLIIFLSWCTACWLLPNCNSRNIAAPISLLATGLTVLVGIFGPQLFSIHKYGGFPHKPLSYADSLSTVFTMFKDLDNTSTSGTTSRGKKSAKTLETPFATEMGEGTRNPLYSDYQSAYP